MTITKFPNNTYKKVVSQYRIDKAIREQANTISAISFTETLNALSDAIEKSIHSNLIEIRMYDISQYVVFPKKGIASSILMTITFGKLS